MSARKSKTAGTNRRNADVARAAYMAAKGIKRTMFRDPITNKMVACGTYPGTQSKAKSIE
jgi:hypothetical protein